MYASSPPPILLFATVVLLAGGCEVDSFHQSARTEGESAPQIPAEARSLLGETLYQLPLAPARRTELLAAMLEAKEAYDTNPADENSAIRYGRRLAYLGQFRDAIAVFSVALRNHPAGRRLLRHRGHRYITVREFRLALNDLSRAAMLIEGVPDELEPDGQPNARNEPRSTTNGNIYYHLGLAHYLQGEFDQAAGAYRQSLALARNDDMRCAALNWLYLSTLRCGREQEASSLLKDVSPRMDVIENTAYHQMLLVYSGQRDAESVLSDFRTGSVEWITAAYGIGAWWRCAGNGTGSTMLFRRIEQCDNWPAFGYIAAEADLARGMPRQEE